MEPDGHIPRPPIEVDEGRCRDCQACSLACSLAHEGGCGPSHARLAVRKDMARYVFGIVVCQHCVEPACLDACPTGALQLDGRGIVIMDEERCTSCGLCEAACPYGAILYQAADHRYLKCDLCAGRGDGPLCVAMCPVGALTLSCATEEA